MSAYLDTKKLDNSLRIPLKCSIDLTYRCNNNCVHCWLRIPIDAKEKSKELTFSEIKNIVDQAKKIGTRTWAISGGEPMLRPDFSEIFDYIIKNSASYSINTNGTLITPKIADMLKAKGAKMIALYGATAKVHDKVTQNPGSFEALMRGFRYLKEKGAGFTVQIIPMKSNYHQYKKMISLAESLSKHWRIGAPWLYLSACGDKDINERIKKQRLTPKEVIELDKPDLRYEESMNKEGSGCGDSVQANGHIFSSCIAKGQEFHVDAYGKMSFCCFMKHPNFRYDLRQGRVEYGWENFIPSLKTKTRVSEEYLKNCGSCELKKDCRYCHVYSYLEHGKFQKKIDYLCEVAKENKRFKENWRKKHRRYYKIADLNIQIDSDIAIAKDSFHSKFRNFQTDSAGEDLVTIRHHFSIPDISARDLGEEVYRKPPWAIYRKDSSWIYLGISPSAKDKSLHRVAIFNNDYTSARIYSKDDKQFLKGDQHSLTFFPTDQILLARILAHKQGFYLHSCGVDFKGKGFLFAGHSEAGKSTTAMMVKDKAKILCDDRMIIRKHPDGFRIHGTWSHGDVPDISSGSAPLAAILFLEKAKKTDLIPLNDKKEIVRRIMACLIRPFVTLDWWDKTLKVIEEVSENTPCYVLKFRKDKQEMIDTLKRL